MASYMLPRHFAYNATRFRFVFRLHLVVITLLALLAVLLLRLAPRLLIVAYMIIMVMVTVVALTILNALPPVRTTHTVDGESVILRQGLNFKLALPLGKISKAKRTEVGTGRAGINLDSGNGVLEVIASGPEAVRLRLNDPVVHKGTLIREVLVDVLEPREFIDCIRERKKGAALMRRLDGAKGTTTPDGDERPPAEAGGLLPDEPSGAEDLSTQEPEPEEPEDEGPEPGEPDVPATPPSGRDRTLAPGPPMREPGEPKELAEGPGTPRKGDDEYEIELVPALPSGNGAPARVVRIPKRKR